MSQRSQRSPGTTEVVPALKNVSPHKSEGGGPQLAAASIFFHGETPGLISMLANFRRPTSSVFGLFTQPEVREVVHEVGPSWRRLVMNR